MYMYMYVYLKQTHMYMYMYIEHVPNVSTDANTAVHVYMYICESIVDSTIPFK